MAKKTLTQQQFERRSQKLWGDKYGYQRALYINTRTPLTLYCKKHKHYFQQTPKAHFIAKHTCCPICSREVSGVFKNQWRFKPTVALSYNYTRFQEVIEKAFNLEGKESE